MLRGPVLGMLLILSGSACQSTAPLRVTHSQQAALDEVVQEVVRQAKDLRQHNALVDKRTIGRLLHERDVRVRHLLNDEQWRHYDVEMRSPLESKIYRASVRRSAPDLRSNTGVRMAPRSEGP